MDILISVARTVLVLKATEITKEIARQWKELDEHEQNE
jgi:hypothetical protein